MISNRREFLKVGVCSGLNVAALSAASGADARREAENPASGRRPVLYNGDEDYYYFRGPERMDRQYLEDIVNHLASAKTTIFSNAFYVAGRCWYGTKEGDRFDNDPYYEYSPATGRFGDITYWREVSNFRRLLAEGNDPLQVFAETCHKRGMKFLACLRMNDRHMIYIEHPPEFIRQHPEMSLKRKDPKARVGMDFQHPEVRDYVFTPMKEMATRYDIDGLELDWMRWCQMFSDDVPREKRVSIMTDYHREIRRMLDEAGKRKNRRLLLSIRVPQTLDECGDLGFDVATYVKEGLIDILCPSDFLFLDPRMDVTAFVSITRGSNVLLMPSLHASPGWACGYASRENLRAVAHSYYQQGASGLSVYNWYQPCAINRPEDFKALEEAGNPHALALGRRDYVFNPLWGGGRKSPTGRLIDWQARLPRSTPGKRETYPFTVKEDFKKVRATLAWKIENLTLEDEVRIDVNGKPLDARQYRMTCFPFGKNEGMTMFNSSWVAGPYYLCELDNASSLLKDGPNEIGITLIRPNPQLNGSITLFETHVVVQP